MAGGGWASSKRRSELPPDWRQRRQARLEADGYQCTEITNGARCTAPATDVHHELGRHDHRHEALRSICTPHHRAHTAREANAAKPKRKREAEAHPGEITRRPE